MLPLTFVFFILVYSIPHFDYLVNTFPFVFEVARLFQMYFMIGAAWACTSYKIVSKCTKDRRILMWVAMSVYFVSQACMLGLIEQFVDVYITSACSFASGLSLMYGIITAFTILIESTQKEDSVKTRAKLALAVSLSAALAGLIAFSGDSLYYTNRDVTYWAYILNSAVPGFGFLSAAILLQT